MASTLEQLEHARKIVLEQPIIYTQVVPGILHVIATGADVELRRWGADFLAEAFASPVLQAEDKQKLALTVLDTLKGYLNRKEETRSEEDATVVKSAVQCAASIYPLVFRHTINNPTDTETWAKMAKMKSSILRRMDAAPPGVRICCIKFVARVVQVQTPGLIADPRRPDQNEISLALVPREHPIIPPSNLEAEASGLLDRLLGVLQDNISDALIVTATLNALATLVQRRPSVSSKILSTVLNFNPLKLAERNMSGKDKIAVKGMTRTTMSFLGNVQKHNPNHTLVGRISHQIARLRQQTMEVFSEENLRKRAAPDEPTDGLDEAKRQKLDRAAEQGATALQHKSQQPPPLPPGSVSLAQIFNLTHDPKTAGFHVEAIPQHFISQLVPAILSSIDNGRIDRAINEVQKRYLEVTARPPQAGPGGDDDSNYDPLEYVEADQPDNENAELPLAELQGTALAPFALSQPPPLTEEEKLEYCDTARRRLFDELDQLDETAKRSKTKKPDADKGFHRPPTTPSDRDGWITLLSRLATRPTFDLPAPNSTPTNIKQENAPPDNALTKSAPTLPDRIRDAFHKYIMTDWRRRLDVANAWLSEEWFVARLRHRADPSTYPLETALAPYRHHALRLLDALVPYLDTRDGRHLIRFLSELPELTPEVFDRIQTVAVDPERVQLAAQTLLYLIMFRPPVRVGAVDCAERIWRENMDARVAVGKILRKWRPEVMEERKVEEGVAEGKGEGNGEGNGDPVKAEGNGGEAVAA